MKSSKVLSLIKQAGPEFYQVLTALERTDLLEQIELLVATEATKNGSNVVLVPSDSAMREFYRSVGLKSAKELASRPSARAFIIAHAGTVKANLGRGKVGGFAGAFVGGHFDSLDRDTRSTDIGFKIMTKSSRTCDEGMGLVKWVVSYKNDVTHMGSANRMDTRYAGEEYDGDANEEGRLDCADFYRIPVVISGEQVVRRILAEGRSSYK